ncbi:thaumatin-like protein [Oryza brachyantha]|uniref:Thaumatin-like protein n=1 Tax=Oryza brachyantha TaxID=4533 RepID=J3L0L2_ORYBR|nr:thaumatin-like protein [Oryza brachyantha]
MRRRLGKEVATVADYCGLEAGRSTGEGFGAGRRQREVVDSSARGAHCAGTLYCNGVGEAPSATLAEITLASTPTAQDFYDVNLINGYNIPVSMTSFHGSGANCVPVGCVGDLNRVVSCPSACVAYGMPQYCRTGVSRSPQQC